MYPPILISKCSGRACFEIVYIIHVYARVLYARCARSSPRSRPDNLIGGDAFTEIDRREIHAPARATTARSGRPRDRDRLRQRSGHGRRRRRFRRGPDETISFNLQIYSLRYENRFTYAKYYPDTSAELRNSYIFIIILSCLVRVKFVGCSEASSCSANRIFF